MSVTKKIGLVVLILAGFALAQAAFQLVASQSGLEKGQRVRDAVPTKAMLAKIQTALEEEQLQIYALLASSKRVRGKNIDPILNTINERLNAVSQTRQNLTDKVLVNEVGAAVTELEAVRARAIEEFQKSSMTRDISMARTWLESSQLAIRRIRGLQKATISPDAVLDTEMQSILLRIDALDKAKFELANFSAIFGGFIAARGHLNFDVVKASATNRAHFESAIVTAFEGLGNLTYEGQPLTADSFISAPLFQLADQTFDFSVNGGERPEGANVTSWFEEAFRVRLTLANASLALNDALFEKVNADMAAARFHRNISLSAGLLCILTVIASVFVMLRSVVGPLNNAVHSIDALAGGDNQVDLSGLPNAFEFGRLRAALEKLARMSREMSELTEKKAEQEQLLRAKERKEAEAAENRLKEEKNLAQAEQLALQETQEAERRAAAEVAVVVSACATGDFSQRLDTANKEGIFSELCQGLNQIGSTANQGLGDVQTALGRLAEGDLTYRMDDRQSGIFGEIAAATNKTVTTLNHTMMQISRVSTSVDNASTEIASVTGDLAKRSEHNAATLNQTRVAIDGMAQSIRFSSEIAKSAKLEVEGISSEATDGQAIMKKAVQAMSKIQESSTSIETILKVIDDIAFQTNLLALNAGVEAARAGDAGRGFAVVASEVRALAARSSEAAGEIAELIDNATKNIDEGVGLVTTSGQTLQHIVNGISQVTERIVEIHENSGKTVDVVEEISASTRKLDQSTQENAAIVEETNAAVRALKSDASALATSVVVFKISENQDHQNEQMDFRKAPNAA